MVKNNQASDQQLFNTEWKALVHVRDAGRISYWAGGAYVSNYVPTETYNLPFILAFCLIDKTLDFFIEERNLKCRARAGIGEKIELLGNQIKWVNLELIQAGINARNDLAHRAILSAKEKCFEYIEAVEVELRSWGMI